MMSKRVERFWKKVYAYEKDETRDKISHSTSYHSYFQGYSEHKVPKKNGKGYRIERIYTADYYRYKEPDNIWRLKKIFYLLMLFGAVMSLIIGGTNSSALNSIQFIGIVQILTWIPMVYLGYTMISQIQARRMMTIGDYRAASDHLKVGALITLVCMIIVIASMILVKLTTLFQVNGNDLAAILGELIGITLVFTLYWAEKERKIEVIKNNTPVPYDANEIW